MVPISGSTKATSAWCLCVRQSLAGSLGTDVLACSCHHFCVLGNIPGMLVVALPSSDQNACMPGCLLCVSLSTPAKLVSSRMSCQLPFGPMHMLVGGASHASFLLDGLCCSLAPTHDSASMHWELEHSLCHLLQSMQPFP